MADVSRKSTDTPVATRPHEAKAERKYWRDLWCHKVSLFEYRVESRSLPELFGYRTVNCYTRPGEWVCKCPGYSNRYSCDHVKRVLWEKALEATAYQSVEEHPWCDSPYCILCASGTPYVAQRQAEEFLAAQERMELEPFWYAPVGNPAPQPAFVPRHTEIPIDSPLVALMAGQ